MRFIVYGAGAIGLLLAAGLRRGGQDVVVVARGSNAAQLRDQGISYVSPQLRTTYAVDVVERADELVFGPDDVVILAVKSQHTREAVAALSERARSRLALACAQNGVANELEVLRCFDSVWGISVGCPATHPAPGTVCSFAAPGPGLLGIGKWTLGPDALTPALVDVFAQAGFETLACRDIRAAKYGKLVYNLPNAIDALCGRAARSSALADDVVAEGMACLRAAGIPFVERDDEAHRRTLARFATIDGEPFPGGSTAQSLSRGDSVETDFLNGEVALIGRLHGFATPLNVGLQRLMTGAAAAQARQPVMSIDELTAALRGEGGCS